MVKLDKSISKLYLLNLDNLLSVIKPLYPDFGRPAKNQQGIIRSLVLMLDQQVYSITNWGSKVASDSLLFDICGFDDRAPATASYYDFLVRLWMGNTLFNVTASDSPYDLPITIKMVQASRHDSITTIFALQDIQRLYPQLRFKNFIVDGAMNNYPTYDLLKHFVYCFGLKDQIKV